MQQTRRHRDVHWQPAEAVRMLTRCWPKKWIYWSTQHQTNRNRLVNLSADGRSTSACKKERNCEWERPQPMDHVMLIHSQNAKSGTSQQSDLPLRQSVSDLKKIQEIYRSPHPFGFLRSFGFFVIFRSDHFGMCLQQMARPLELNNNFSQATSIHNPRQAMGVNRKDFHAACQNQVANSANGTNLGVLNFQVLETTFIHQNFSKIVSWSEKIKKTPSKLKKPAQRVETQLTPFMGHLDSRNLYLLLKEDLYPKINTTGLRSETMAADVHHLPRNFRPKEFPSLNHNNSGSNTKAESKSLPEEREKKNIDPK